MSRAPSEQTAVGRAVAVAVLCLIITVWAVAAVAQTLPDDADRLADRVIQRLQTADDVPLVRPVEDAADNPAEDPAVRPSVDPARTLGPTTEPEGQTDEKDPDCGSQIVVDEYGFEVELPDC